MTQSVQQLADQVADLMENRLRIRGPSLSAKLRKGGRKLPRRVRKAAEVLAGAADFARHPKGLMMVDMARTEAAAQTCLSYLRPLGGKERFKSAALNFAGTLALMLLVVGAAIVAVLALRGFI